MTATITRTPALVGPTVDSPARIDARVARIARRRKAIAAAIDGADWAQRIAAELELADPVVEEAIAHDMTTAITDRVVW